MIDCDVSIAVDPDADTDPNPDPVRIQGFDDQKLKNKNKADFFLIQKLTSKLQEKPLALKRKHPALQKMKFINFFLCLWVIFALLGPHRIRIQSGSTTLDVSAAVSH
jgi:hypothetical protein